MYVRPLKYNKPAAQHLLDILNYTNKTAFESTQLTFGTPMSIPENEHSINQTHIHDYDHQRPSEGTLTQIQVRPGAASAWTKAATLTYRRTVIQDHFASVPVVIYTTDTEHQTVLDAILLQYGLYLDAHLVDIEFEPVDINDVLFQTHMGSIVDNEASCYDYAPPFTYDGLVKIKPEHPIWMGELHVYIRDAVRLLDRNIKTTLAIKEYLGPGNHDKMPAEMILPMNRFTDHDYHLRSYKADDLVLEAIVDTAKEVTGDEWVFDPTPRPFNLYGAKVIYNGLNTGEVYINDPKVSNVIIIQFSNDRCTNIAGQWIIGYYNHDTWLKRQRVDNYPLQAQ